MYYVVAVAVHVNSKKYCYFDINNMFNMILYSHTIFKRNFPSIARANDMFSVR